MNIYHCRSGKLSGSSYDEVLPLARKVYRLIADKTKRTPYVRSAYFGGEKVFLNIFWAHLGQKNSRDRARRLKFYGCAIELLKSTRNKPKILMNPNGKKEIVYRFSGKSKEGVGFDVQVKQDRRGGKHFMSVIPTK